MKLFLLSVFIFFVLSACSNFKEDLKSTGDTVQTGTQNALEAAKQAPADLSKAMNKVEDDIRK
jgi:CHASE3 domain sensor protein